MLDFSRFEWLSFDCYGTLIDWETGLLGYLRPLLESKGHPLSDAQILNLYSEFEPRAQSGPYRSYREVLAQVVRDFARELRFSVSHGRGQRTGGIDPQLAALCRHGPRVAPFAVPLQTRRTFQY